MKMKVVLVAGWVVLLFLNNANAQLKTEFGLKGGPSLAGLSLNAGGKLSGVKYGNITGFHAGGYALLRVGKLGIQPELIFSRQGQEYNTQYDNNLRTDLSYLNVPVIIKYYLVGGLNLQAGPQFGFLLGGKGDLVTITSGNVGQAVLSQNLKSYLNSTDFSFGFGGGVDLPFGGSISIRYNLGLSDINKYDSKNLPTNSNGDRISSSFSTASTRNHVLQISVGYRLYKIGK